MVLKRLQNGQQTSNVPLPASQDSRRVPEWLSHLILMDTNSVPSYPPRSAFICPNAPIPANDTIECIQGISVQSWIKKRTINLRYQLQTARKWSRKTSLVRNHGRRDSRTLESDTCKHARAVAVDRPGQKTLKQLELSKKAHALSTNSASPPIVTAACWHLCNTAS